MYKMDTTSTPGSGIADHILAQKKALGMSVRLAPKDLDTTSYTLKLSQLWQMLADCLITSDDVTMADVDGIVLKVTGGSADETHDPSVLVFFHEFAEILVRISHAKFYHLDSLPQRIQALLADFILPRATKPCADPIRRQLAQTESQTVIADYSQTLQELFAQVATDGKVAKSRDILSQLGILGLMEESQFAVEDEVERGAIGTQASDASNTEGGIGVNSAAILSGEVAADEQPGHTSGNKQEDVAGEQPLAGSGEVAVEAATDAEVTNADEDDDLFKVSKLSLEDALVAIGSVNESELKHKLEKYAEDMMTSMERHIKKPDSLEDAEEGKKRKKKKKQRSKEAVDKVPGSPVLKISEEEAAAIVQGKKMEQLVFISLGFGVILFPQYVEILARASTLCASTASGAIASSLAVLLERIAHNKQNAAVASAGATVVEVVSGGK